MGQLVILVHKITYTNASIRRNKTWEQFKHLQKGFENSRGIRLFHFDETIEILMPGTAHELFKSVIGFLVETFLFHIEVEFEPTGSTTQEKAEVASVEADESYEIEGLKLSIGVNFTSGDIDKLARYKALNVDEVWFWGGGVLDVYHLQSNSCEKVDRSVISSLSILSRQLLAECILIGETSQTKAVKKLLKTYCVQL